MAAKTFMRLVGGVLTEIFGTQASAGAGNAGDLVALDDAGRIDESMMPVGLGADVAIVSASEALIAGDWVNIWDSSGSFKVRKADGSTVGKEAHGFVLVGVASNNDATVYFEGTNTQVTGQTPGKVYLSAAAAGKGVATPPAGSGKVVQCIGVAASATAVNFEPHPPVTLA